MAASLTFDSVTKRYDTTEALSGIDLTIEAGSFVALVPAPLSIGTLALADGGSVQGFLCEPLALQGASDISHLGGWRAFIARG